MPKKGQKNNYLNKDIKLWPAFSIKLLFEERRSDLQAVKNYFFAFRLLILTQHPIHGDFQI
jgi:hypothetical protein